MSRNSVSRSILNDSAWRGIDDDAREPRGVEQPFLLVEVPAPRLLGEQAALEAVGEAGDDVRKPAHLLVEIGAQPRQFLLVAQLFSLDDLVETRCERFIVGDR